MKDAIKQVSISRLEEKHKKGYESYPVGNTEFIISESDLEWGAPSTATIYKQSQNQKSAR